MARKPHPPLTPELEQEARATAENLLAEVQADIENHQIHTDMDKDAIPEDMRDAVAARVMELTRGATAVWTLPEDDPDSRCGASTKTATGRTWCWNTDVPHTHHHNAYGFTWTD